MEAKYYLVILVTLVGFLALAAMLLVPVYRFLRSEERIAETWTRDELERRAKARDGVAADVQRSTPASGAEPGTHSGSPD